jgi:UDP-N-acetylmuramoyl-L-alanyl-D-glutamate--2,6-diaminopimelate ligase
VRIDRLDRRRSDFQLFGRTFETPVRLSLLGRHNVENALAAAATADAIGIPAAAIASGLELLAGVPGRLQRVEPQGWPVSVLVDYAHTDAALSSVLHALRPLTRGRLICVFGCGGDRDRTKRARMAAAVGAWADMAYVTSDNPRSEDPQRIIDDILLGFGPSRRCRVEAIVDRRRAIQHAVAVARSGDTVLIAGKGHETCQLVGGAVLPFDDVEVARECLSTASLAEGAA